MHARQLHEGPVQSLMRRLNTLTSQLSLRLTGKIFQREEPEYFNELSPKVIVLDLGCLVLEESLRL